MRKNKSQDAEIWGQVVPSFLVTQKEACDDSNVFIYTLKRLMLMETPLPNKSFVWLTSGTAHCQSWSGLFTWLTSGALCSWAGLALVLFV